MTDSKVKLVEIDVQRAGQRIDNYLLSQFGKVPKSRIYRALRNGEVRVNKRRVKPVYRIQAGDIVRLPPLYSVSADVPVTISKEKCDWLEQTIIFEDEHFIAINKPAGIAAHSGSGDRYGVIEVFRASREYQPYLELVHRIDKETSGCLLLAKSRPILLDAQQAMQSDQTSKSYKVFVQGSWQVKNHRVEHALQKSYATGPKMAVDEDGVTATTIFSTERVTQQGSLMHVKILSGRTHQIRIHAQAEQHPVAGDKRYGDFAYNRSLQTLGLNRMFLHAHSLKIYLTKLSQSYEFVAPLATELKQFCKRLD